jgi:hypothetical protein
MMPRSFAILCNTVRHRFRIFTHPPPHQNPDFFSLYGHHAGVDSRDIHAVGFDAAEFFPHNLFTLVSVLRDFTAFAAVQCWCIGHHNRRLAVQQHHGTDCVQKITPGSGLIVDAHLAHGLGGKEEFLKV